MSAEDSATENHPFEPVRAGFPIEPTDEELPPEPAHDRLRSEAAHEVLEHSSPGQRSPMPGWRTLLFGRPAATWDTEWRTLGMALATIAALALLLMLSAFILFTAAQGRADDEIGATGSPAGSPAIQGAPLHPTTTSSPGASSREADPSPVSTAVAGPGPAFAPSPTAATRRHLVRPGDTLFSVARAYGVTVEEVARANDLVDESFIWVGQELVIPGSGRSP